MANPLRFGIKASGQGITVEQLRAVWRIADEGGFDHLWDFDHLASIGPAGPDRPIYEGWALQAAMAEATKRVRIGCLVTGNTYRHPVVLAKLAVTVDHLSGGRNFDGRYYKITDAIANPKPIQKPHPPIWIGAQGESTLRLTARHADVWNISGGDPEFVGEVIKKFDAACAEVGRDPGEVRRSLQYGWDGKDRNELIELSGKLLELGVTEQVLYLRGDDPVGLAEKIADMLPDLRALDRVAS